MGWIEDMNLEFDLGLDRMELHAEEEARAALAGEKSFPDAAREIMERDAARVRAGAMDSLMVSAPGAIPDRWRGGLDDDEFVREIIR